MKYIPSSDYFSQNQTNCLLLIPTKIFKSVLKDLFRHLPGNNYITEWEKEVLILKELPTVTRVLSQEFKSYVTLGEEKKITNKFQEVQQKIKNGSLRKYKEYNQSIIKFTVRKVSERSRIRTCLTLKFRLKSH